MTTNILRGPAAPTQRDVGPAYKASLTREEAERIVADYMRPHIAPALKQRNDVVEWGQANFYVPETASLIKLEPVQQVILRKAFDPAFATAMGCPQGFQNYLYSSLKKSGKTTIASMVARWVGETWGAYNEVFCMANDLEQARGRVYAKALQSMELDPNYDRTKRVLPGKWRIIERDALNLQNGSIIRAVSSDYKGEAGSNPTATFWSELWGYTTEASRRMWAELTPVPTRARSIRWVETYAGFENESDLLLELWERATKHGRQLTRADVPDWPYPDEWMLPLYVNPAARTFAYIDQGTIARRMPWQTPEYYVAQEATLRPNEFDRLHNNFWISPASEFAPVEWWDRLTAGRQRSDGTYEVAPLPPLDDRTPIVLSADAAVSNDCMALTGVSRAPENDEDVALRTAQIWTPPHGGKFDYDESLVPAIIDLCSRYNVVCLTYDPYQLHNVATRLTAQGICWCLPFDQGTTRLKADKMLYDLIRDKRLPHIDDPTMREHFMNCAAQQSKTEDTKLRIVKRSEAKKIDGIISLSMGAFECLRLNLN